MTNLAWLLVAAAGLAVLAASSAVASRDVIGPVEVRLFHAVNGLPGWLYPLLWLPMQLGNLVVGTAVGVVAGALARNLAVVAGSLLAMWMKLVTERWIRRRMAVHLAVRQRPGVSQDGAVLRGDVPASGPSYPSGHIILVAAVSCVVMPVVPMWSWWLPALLTLLVMVGRVYVGAHNPFDVTAGLGAGLLVGGVVAVFVA